MPAVPLTPEMIDLVLFLCQTHSDELNTRLVRSFMLVQGGDLGRLPDERDVRIVKELELTRATYKVLEAAK